MSDWFHGKRPTEPTTERPLPGQPVAEHAEAATAALDKIQSDYERNADQLQREFSQHADATQARFSPPE